MEKIKKVVTSPLFLSAVAGGIGLAVLIKGDILYAGIAFGVGIREFLLAFKDAGDKKVNLETGALS